MLPPTGITFLIHGTVVLVKKIAQLLGIVQRKPKEEVVFRRLNAVLSITVIVVITLYVSSAAFFFVERAAADDRATWRIAHREATKFAKGLWNKPIMENHRAALPMCYTYRAESPLLIEPPNFSFITQNRLDIRQQEISWEPYTSNVSSIINQYQKTF